MSKQYLYTEMRQAIGKGDTKEVRKLIDNKADVNSHDKYNNTLLLETFVNSYIDKEILCKIAKQLIDAGADLYHKNIYEYSPLEAAIDLKLNKQQLKDLELCAENYKNIQAGKQDSVQCNIVIDLTDDPVQNPEKCTSEIKLNGVHEQSEHSETCSLI